MMMLIKKVACISLLFFVSYIFFMHPILAVGNSEQDNTITVPLSKHKVILVLDGSASVCNFDSEKVRFKAIEYFLDLFAFNDNFVGAIVFSSYEIGRVKPIPINNEEDKKTIIKELEEDFQSGSSNPGVALKDAVSLLNSDDGIPASIVFISDGITSLKNDKGVLISLQLLTEAFEQAKKNAVSINTICLDSNGNEYKQNLKKHSEAAGGIFCEISSSKELYGYFDSIDEVYCHIFGIKMNDIIDGNFVQGEIVEKSLNIPSDVEELCVSARGNIEDIWFSVGNESLRVSLDKTYDIMSKPEKNPCFKVKLKKFKDVPNGELKIQLKAKSTETVSVKLFFNSTIDLCLKRHVANCFVNDEVSFSIALLSKGCPVLNDELYFVNIIIKKIDNMDDITEKTMAFENDYYIYSHNFSSYGDYSLTYKVFIRIDNNDIILGKYCTSLHVNKLIDISTPKSVIYFIEKTTPIMAAFQTNNKRQAISNTQTKSCYDTINIGIVIAFIAFCILNIFLRKRTTEIDIVFGNRGEHDGELNNDVQRYNVSIGTNWTKLQSYLAVRNDYRKLIKGIKVKATIKGNVKFKVTKDKGQANTEKRKIKKDESYTIDLEIPEESGIVLCVRLEPHKRFKKGPFQKIGSIQKWSKEEKRRA